MAAQGASPRDGSQRPPVPQATYQLAKDDALAAWQAKPRVQSRWLDTYVNYMVLGESGLGKTTFINNLISSYAVSTPARIQDSNTTTLSQFQGDSESLRTVLEPMMVPECSRRVIISIQDMPGWGDDVNLTRYLRAVASFLLEQRIKDYEKLDGGCNFDPTTMCGQLPHSITACLYFLPPHRTKKIDLVLMAAVSQLVPIIPVIAKADCMTDRELATYRNEVQGMLQSPNKYTSGRNMPQLDVFTFQFSQAIIEGLAMRSLPLAVSCSRDVEPCDDPAFLQSMGLEGLEKPVQPVRHYKWGAVYPLNRGHSDLIVLKRLLLGDRVDSLYAMLDESYSRYVAFCGLYEENDRQLQLILQDACQVGVPYLEYDNSVKARTALSSAKSAMTILTEENRMLAERLAEVEAEKAEIVETLRRKHGGRSVTSSGAGVASC
ncbi:hypothetical protein OEZ85_006381 [Tetradesmus obliquus]|uniref:Septin-type G domain-containing protein n=1 Tax=Tetradesmus obliquus TaxID=3088 RepID=A0ABY8TUF5_TETOB|nr:hypothetical protein OEZ85_006381 [Tetradesmus obliquus]